MQNILTKPTLDAELYRIKTNAEMEKDKARMLSLIAQLPTWGAAFLLKSILGVFGYAKSQKISTDQALTEKILAMPARFPDAIHNVSDWVAICNMAGINAVPCFKGPSISVEELETFADTQTATPNTDQIALWILQEHAKGRTWRWECCAPENLKLYAGLRRTEPKHQELPKIKFQVDDRLFHILWDQQAINISVVSRPWIKPMMDDGFPVEFRVFHTPEGNAACNYYPQRRLHGKYYGAMESAVDLTQKLAEFQVPEDSGLPKMPKAFSCDWMLTSTGELIFLEAGPPHSKMGGAHPCCFGLFDDQGHGPLPGRRLLASEPTAQFYVDDRIQAGIDAYKTGNCDFNKTAKKIHIHPRTLASIMMVQGIIPREMAEKEITN